MRCAAQSENVNLMVTGLKHTVHSKELPIQIQWSLVKLHFQCQKQSVTEQNCQLKFYNPHKGLFSSNVSFKVDNSTL